MKRAISAAYIFVLLGTAWPFPAAAKKPKNFRLRPRAAVSPADAAPAVAPSRAKAASPAPSWDAPRLAAGRWTPEVRSAVDRLMLERGKGARGYDEKTPPVAVIPWDDAAVGGDAGEALLLRLVSRAEFKFDDSFWEIVPLAYGRRPIRAAYEQFSRLPRSVWGDQPAYHQYRRGLLESYYGLRAGVGRKEARSYLARLLAGFSEDELSNYVRGFLKEEKAETRAVEDVPREPGDPAPLRVRRGLRVVPEMRDLVSKLLAAGFDVWVADAEPQTLLVEAAADYGVDKTRVLGVRPVMERSRLGAGVLKPVPVRGGKTDAVQRSIGRPADLVIGRDGDDSDLMAYGKGLRIALDRDPEFAGLARERGWLVQPPLSR